MAGKIKTISNFIETLAGKGPKLTLTSIRILLYIIEEEETTFEAIEKKFGIIPRSTISRNLSELTEVTWKREAGLNLVEFSYDSQQPRRKIISLTKQGKQLKNKFAK